MYSATAYEGISRECDNCGHFTSAHSYCAACDMNICEGCDHACECKHCHQDLKADGTCQLCDSTCGFCNEPMLECVCDTHDEITFDVDDDYDDVEEDDDSCCPDYAAAYANRRVA